MKERNDQVHLTCSLFSSVDVLKDTMFPHKLGHLFSGTLKYNHYLSYFS